MNGCEPGCSCCGPTETTSPIVVTINPEARVSVQRTDVPLGTAAPDQWLDIPFDVINQGFVTGALTIEPSRLHSVELHAAPTALSGSASQRGRFRVRAGAGVVEDITLRFWARGALGGLADRNSIDLLIRGDS